VTESAQEGHADKRIGLRGYDDDEDLFFSSPLLGREDDDARRDFVEKEISREEAFEKWVIKPSKRLVMGFAGRYQRLDVSSVPGALVSRMLLSGSLHFTFRNFVYTASRPLYHCWSDEFLMMVLLITLAFFNFS
jgi:hypothetical protein